MGIDISEYQAKKAAGLVSMAKIGSSLAIAKRRFSSETGREELPEMVAISIPQLEEQKAQTQDIVDALDAMIAEGKALLEQG